MARPASTTSGWFPAPPADKPQELSAEAVDQQFRAADEERHRADVERNREAWNLWAPDYFMPGLEAWQAPEPRWGIWELPESELNVLDGIDAGVNVIELGCGTGAACAWMASRGAIPIGIDVAEAQLESARMLQKQFSVEFPLIRTSADAVPFADGSFDVALSEHGASTWLDPTRWLPEANRLLRPGGLLVFMVCSPTLMACTPEVGDVIGPQLVRDHFGMGRCPFPEDDTVEYHVAHADWIRLLRENGFAVEDLVEVRPPDGAKARYGLVTAEWARRWPSEDVWRARKVA
jgi:SAM-dependent methyltransferase